MRRITADDILKVVEPIVYAKRNLTMGILVALTAFLLYMALQLEVDAGFEKSLPLQHEYMQTFRKYQREFGGANTILVALVNKDGTEIYNEEFLTKLKQVTDEVFFLPGVDRSRVQSLFTPNTRYIEVVEGGFAGGNVIPADYAPSPEMFQLVKTNVGKAGIVGRMVTNTQNGAMVSAELLERDPVTGEKLDYRIVADNLEKIRQDFETENIGIHIIGFAKVIGDVTDAAGAVVGFFLLALVMTGLLLWVYVGSFLLAFIVLFTSLVAVVWEFGIFTLAGFGLDPFAILVPFLVLSVSVSHGVQYANSWVQRIFAGDNSFDASLETFRRLAIPGTTALITDVAGFATIYLIEIDIIREMALNAAFGIAAIIVTNKMMIPIWLTWVKIRDIEKFKVKAKRRDEFGEGLWRLIAKSTHTGPAVAILMVCAVLLGWSFWKYNDLKIGDFKKGVPELRPDSVYNKDSATIVDNFAIGVDILKVVVETVPEACIKYNVMESIDRFAWNMDNLTGQVSSTISLAQVAKIVNMGWSEGSLSWRVLPRNQFVMVQAINPIDTSSGLFNSDCSAMPVFIFTKDHKAETISVIVDAVKEFDAEWGNHDGWRPPAVRNPPNPIDYDEFGGETSEEFLADKADYDAQLSVRQDWVAPEAGSDAFDKGPFLKFSLATGNVGVMAATNEVVKAQELSVVGWVYVVVVVFLYLSFFSISGVLCVALPLTLVTIMGYGVMASLEIGLKVATLPVLALAVGIGVDYGIYIYSVFVEGYKTFHLSMEDAYYRTMKKTGKAVIFIGISLGGSVATWLFSDLQFQADMGAVLVFLFTANMFGAILVLPALARFLCWYDVPEEKVKLEDIDESKATGH